MPDYISTLRKDGTHAAALFSTDGCFRFWLSRDWSAPSQQPAKTCLFIMLNPSTATHEIDDPTIRKCVGFAKRWGYTAIEVMNLFPYRATDPKLLLTNVAEHTNWPNSVTAELWRRSLALNDELIRVMVANVDTVICAWGANARHPLVQARVRNVVDILIESGYGGWAINVLKGNVPAHPLMQKYADQPVPFNFKAPA